MVVRDRIVKIVVKRDGEEEGEDVYRVRRVSGSGCTRLQTSTLTKQGTNTKDAVGLCVM